MANPFIEKNVTEIIEENKEQFPLNMALASSWIVANFKGMNIKIFDVAETSSLADYYVIGSVNNPTQARSIADELLFNLKKHGEKNLSIEGLETGDWVLLDMGDIIVHLFLEHTRDIFGLDILWAKYDQVQVPTEYFTSAVESASTDKKSTGYF
jgi:ribosome-associated protein